MEGVQSPPGPAPRAPDEASRKEVLRKKGAEYFEQILAKASEDKHPPVVSPGHLTTSGSGRMAGDRSGVGKRGSTTRRTVDLERLDPDLETVGLVLEGMRLYFIAAVFVLASAASLAFVQAALQPLKVPGVQAFLHLLPTVAALWVVVDVGPITASTLQGSAVPALTYGLQTLCVFGALVEGSVYFVLSWTVLLVPLIGVGVDRALLGTPLPVLAVLGLVLGAGAPAVVLVVRDWPAFSSLTYLIIWAAVEAGRQLWDSVRHQPDSFTGGLRAEVAAAVRHVAAAQGDVEPAAQEFLRTALPAVPLLLLGFIKGEGPTLLDHELSVPAVTMMLLSAAAWAVAATTGLLLQEAVPSQRRRIALRFVAALGSLGVAGMVNGWGKSGQLAAASFAILGGSAAQFFRFKH